MSGVKKGKFLFVFLLSLLLLQFASASDYGSIPVSRAGLVSNHTQSVVASQGIFNATISVSIDDLSDITSCEYLQVNTNSWNPEFLTNSSLGVWAEGYLLSNDATPRTGVVDQYCSRYFPEITSSTESSDLYLLLRANSSSGSSYISPVIEVVINDFNSSFSSKYNVLVGTSGSSEDLFLGGNIVARAGNAITKGPFVQSTGGVVSDLAGGSPLLASLKFGVIEGGAEVQPLSTDISYTYNSSTQVSDFVNINLSLFDTFSGIQFTPVRSVFDSGYPVYTVLNDAESQVSTLFDISESGLFAIKPDVTLSEGVYRSKVHVDLNSSFVSKVNVTINVTKPRLVVQASPAYKLQGDSDPSFSVTYSGFKNNDNESVLSGNLAFNRESGESDGYYQVQPYNLTAQNYTLDFINSTLRIFSGDSMFVSSWNTSLISSGSSNSTQVSLPLVNSGSYDFFVKWGDGNQSHITSYNSTNVTHDYASASNYTISIYGFLDGFSFSNSGDKLKILNITQWGDLSLGNDGSYFYGASNLIINTSDVLNTSTISDFSNFFRDSGITYIQNLSQWDFSNASNMSSFLQNASLFEGSLDGIETSTVVDLSNFMYGITNYSGVVPYLNISSALYLTDMFTNTNISSNNLDSLLNYWANNLSVNSNISFNVLDKSLCNSRISLSILKQFFGWNILDFSSSSCQKNSLNQSFSNKNLDLDDSSYDFNFSQFYLNESSIKFSSRNFSADNSSFVVNGSTLRYSNISKLIFKNTSFTLSNSSMSTDSSQIENSSFSLTARNNSNVSLTTRNSSFPINISDSIITLDLSSSNISYDLNNSQIVFKNGSYANINFMSNISSNGVSLEKIYSIGIKSDFNTSAAYPYTYLGNPAFSRINSSLDSNFNISSNVTFNFSGFKISNMTIFRNGFECNATTSPSCNNISFDNGVLSYVVSSWSDYEVQGTFSASCGDGVLDTNSGEVCDTSNFGALDCSDFGSYNTGSLSCSSSCKVIDSSQCSYVEPSAPSSSPSSSPRSSSSSSSYPRYNSLDKTNSTITSTDLPEERPGDTSTSDQSDFDGTDSAAPSSAQSDAQVITEDFSQDKESLSLGKFLPSGLLLTIILGVFILGGVGFVFITNKNSSKSPQSSLFSDQKLYSILSEKWYKYILLEESKGISLSQIGAQLEKRGISPEVAKDIMSRFSFCQRVSELSYTNIPLNELKDKLVSEGFSSKLINFLFKKS